MPFKFNVFTGNFDYYQSGGVSSTVSASFRADVAVTPAPDGVQTVFTIPEEYLANSITVYVNGLAETYFAQTTSTSVTLETAPITGDIIRVSYMLATGSDPHPGSDLLSEDGDFILSESGDTILSEA